MTMVPGSRFTASGRTGFQPAPPSLLPLLLLLILCGVRGVQAQIPTDLTFMASDGILLEATLTIPSTPVPPLGFPGIVFIHGYGGNKTDYAPVATYLAAQGYASLLYSVRGQGNSGGLSTTMGERERLDLQEVIRFFRASAGIDSTRIGVAGGSQGGIHAWMAAAYRMSGVGAIATLVAPPSFALDLVPAGCFKQQLWTELNLASVRYAPERDRLRDFVIAGQVDSVRALVASRDLEHLLDSVRIPVMQLLGWADVIFPANGAFRALKRLSSRGVPVWSYFGTNGHGEPVNLNETLFQLSFMTSWFDHWFKGTPLERADEPLVVFADNRPGWPHRETVGWPPEPAGTTRLYLSGWSLRTTPPSATTEAPFTLAYDTAYTPARGWADGYQGAAFRQAFRSTPARFVSEPLADTLDITGIPAARLILRSAGTRYQTHVRLFDVAPADTGLVWSVMSRGASGIRGAIPGSQTEQGITCEAMSHHVFPGHRIGVEVTSLDMYDSQRAHIVPYFSGSSATVISSGVSASYVDLPLIGGAVFTTVPGPAASLPSAFSLSQNYPNPFNPATRIEYMVPVDASPGMAAPRVRLAVYDLLGREVTVLVDAVQPAGTYSASFDGAGLASGTYLYRLSAGAWSATRRMVLVR